MRRLKPNNPFDGGYLDSDLIDVPLYLLFNRSKENQGLPMTGIDKNRDKSLLNIWYN